MDETFPKGVAAPDERAACGQGARFFDSRREFLGRTLAAAGALACADWPGRVIADGEAVKGLLIRSRRPLDAETPVEAFTQYRTPNDLFFVRSHFGEPAVGLGEWRLGVGGEVERPLDLTLDDLVGFETVRRAAVLQCAGNGRAFHEPTVPGLAWGRGAVGNAEWEGVRLADVLERAGLRSGTKHVHLVGADGPPSPKTPAYLRSIPLERALDPGTLIATRMNGEPLPVLHGGPLRLVVPGWTGNHWMKWLRGITASVVEAPGFYQQTGYRMPVELVSPGTTVPPEDMRPVTWMNVKSLIASPGAGRPLGPGPTEVLGVAWTGLGRVEKVEVRIDDGPWRPAELIGPDVEGSWRQWRFAWTPEAGRRVLRSRATDSQGESQPEETPWNRSGYLWNGIDRVECEVMADA